MSNLSLPRIPSYRHHKASGRAIVTLGGRDVYLGDWNSAASRREYRRVIAEWLASGAPDHGTTTADEITIVELIARYWQFVRGYYCKSIGRPTEIQGHIRRSLMPVKQLYGHTRRQSGL